MLRLLSVLPLLPLLVLLLAVPTLIFELCPLFVVKVNGARWFLSSPAVTAAKSIGVPEATEVRGQK